MIKSIINRTKSRTHMTETEIKVIRGAVKLFLSNGFSNTTLKMIQEETGVKLGNITYYFRAKEDMLYLLIEEVMDFRLDVIDETAIKTGDPLVACAVEVALQIALCENNDKALDLYYSAYTLPNIFEMIKDWTAKKNFHLLGKYFPDYSEADFRRIENVVTCIELAGLRTPCDRYFTLNDKIELVLDSIMKIYEIEKSERERVIKTVLSLDLEKIGQDVFEKFVARLDNPS